MVCNIEIDSEICYQSGMLGTTLRLSRPEYKELQARVRSRVLRAGDVRRARLILMLCEGQSWSAIQQALGCSSAYIARWQARFTQQRLAGLFARHQGRPVSKRTPRLEARILAWTRRAPDDAQAVAARPFSQVERERWAMAAATMLCDHLGIEGR